MEENANAVSPYAACRHYKRTTPDTTTFDEATVRSITTDARIFPLFEKKLSDLKRIRHYSLRRNQLLSCRWRRYVDTNLGRVRYPFQFPRIDDFHFYNYHNRYAPAQSISKDTRHPHQMGIGPGVDKYGEIPIPVDIHRSKPLESRRSGLASRPS